MKTSSRFAVLMVLISATMLSALQAGSRPAAAKDKVKDEDPAWSALKTSMTKMHADMMSVKPSHNSDADFVRLMLLHHQAALDMARSELTYGRDPQMLRLAQEMVTDQQSEIELMQLWLKSRESVSGTPSTNLPLIQEK